MKLKKRYWVPALLVLASLFLAFRPRHYFINLPEGKTEIPAKIVAAKDCAKLREWLMSKARPGFMPDFACPWAKIGPVGHFEMGGVKLEIPREYIWFDRNQPDGPTDGINLMFHWPDMGPGDADAADRSMNVNVLLEYRGDMSNCSGTCFNYSQELYKVFALSKYSLVEVNPDANAYDSSLNLSSFARVQWHYIDQEKHKNIYSKEDIFFRGNSLTPDYWLICKVNYNHIRFPRCTSSYFVENKLHAKYGFRRETLLPHHDELRQKLDAKLKSFIQPQSIKE